MQRKIKNFVLNVLFPKFCLNCKKEGSYLCPDCQSLLEISGFHKNRSFFSLNDLYFVAGYKNPLIKNLINSFKYEPFVKELGRPLASLIISHFKLMDKKPNFYPFIEKNKNLINFAIIPVPLHKKRLKWRGFNQAEVLSKELAVFFKIPLVSDSLIRAKETFPQTELSIKERRENIKGAFFVKKEKLIKNKNVLLIDDVYTTGSTMQECANVLKKAGGKKVVGIVLARG